MSVFRLSMPTPIERAVLVEVPHAGLAIPAALEGRIVASSDAMRRDADLHVDRLYEDAPSVGAVLLTASLSRYVVDLNRAPDDLDFGPASGEASRKAPRGVVWRFATDGRPILGAPFALDDARERVALYHAPYHAALRSEIDRLRRTHGSVRVLAAHSMPSGLRSDVRARRADVVPGSRGRTSASARMIDLVDAHFREAGLEVRHDEPYRGGYTTQHYGRPDAGVHVVQIELNRALYMDEKTFAPLEGRFDEVRAMLTRLVEKLGAL